MSAAVESVEQIDETIDAGIEREGLTLLLPVPPPAPPDPPHGAAAAAYTIVEDVIAVRTFLHGAPALVSFMWAASTTPEERRIVADAHERVVALRLGTVPEVVPRLRAV